MLRQHHLALDDCRAAIRLDPTFIKAYLRAAKCHASLGQMASAERELTQGLAAIEALTSATHLTPKEIAARVQQKPALAAELGVIRAINAGLAEAHAAYDSARYRRCIQAVEMAMMKVDPQLSPRAGGEGSQIESVYTRLDSTQLNGVPVSWRLLRARCVYALGDYQNAQTLVTFILQSQPRHADAICLRAEVITTLALHDPAQVQALLTQALAYDPDAAAAKTLRKELRELEAIKQQGNAAFGQQDWDTARTAYNQFLAINRWKGIGQAKVLSNLALVESKTGNYTQACDLVTRAVDTAAFYQKLLTNRASWRMQLKEYEEAVRDYTVLCQNLAPKQPSLRQALKTAKELHQKASRKDYYEILGISDRGCSQNQLKKAYHKLALQYHPDKTSRLDDAERAKAEAKFRDIQEAWSVLGDEDKRARVDAGIHVDGASASGDSGMHSHHHGFGGGMGGMGNQEDILRMFFGGGGMGGGMGGMGGGGGGRGGHPGFGFQF
ncbi:DnaJ-domain-containing protein [Caulochytrium protostelioides]|uniref:DnaJ-domain-containing protein n=1 Tax=Caulochytrium protostelioides TaxID=1555241 RepID=A0A4P9WWZ7_9FUNG|nr:DnaJ-domain-containing protein [Caulochytrium protostelioides]